MRVLLLVLRTTSYLAFAVVLIGVAAVVFVNASGVCPRYDEGAVQCVSPIYRTIGGIGLFIVFMAAFTIVPALFALAGLVFLVRDLSAFLRRRRSFSGRTNRP